MGNRTLKYGGKSGILPKPRPIFKKNPIRPLTKEELSDYESADQGYAENIPLPVKKGFKFQRKLEPRPVITVDERIRKTIDASKPTNVDESKLNEQELWKLKAGDIRREHLRQAYIKEEQRLKKIDELKKKKAEEEAEEAKTKQIYEESEATKLTLPTFESHLKGPIMRQRTETEQALLDHQRAYNRKAKELKVEENKAEQLLHLYHASGNFITTEEQLEKAITEAFEIKLNKFNIAHLTVRDKLSGSIDRNITLSENEDLVLDAAYGEINRKPGLNVVKDTINGQIEKLRREAELASRNNQ